MWRGVVWRDVVWRGGVWRGVAWCGAVWLVEFVACGGAWYGVASSTNLLLVSMGLRLRDRLSEQLERFRDGFVVRVW